MFCQWPVACLTVHMRVLASAFGVKDVCMAVLACLMARKFDGMGRNLADCIAAIVTILPEAGWDNVMSNDKKDNESKNKESREPE